MVIGLYIFRPRMITCKINFDENRLIYFLIKKEKEFIKYKEILEKFRNIIKNKFNSQLLYNKKYLKAEKINKRKEALNVYIH